jgi:hypothetical protein
VLKQQPQLFGTCVFDDYHQSSYGWTIRSYWLTDTGFRILWTYLGGRKSRKIFIAMIPYLEAFDAKQAELQARLGVETAAVEAGDLSLMAKHPSWLSRTVKGALCIANNTNDPVMLRRLMLIAIDDVVAQLGKVGDLHSQHHFIVHDLHNLMGLDHTLTRKDVDFYSELG